MVILTLNSINTDLVFTLNCMEQVQMVEIMSLLSHMLTFAADKCVGSRRLEGATQELELDDAKMETEK